MVTTSERAWFGRDAGPPTSGVSPIRHGDRAEVRDPSVRPDRRFHDRAHR